MSTTIPATHLAAQYDEPRGKIEIRQVAVPEPEDEDVLVRLEYSGVCYSDVSIRDGLFPASLQNFPCTAGHEGAGVVAKTGAKVKDFKVGDRVGVKWINGTCLNCEPCRAGKEVNCQQPLLSGFTRPGTYQQFTLIRATDAIRIPDEIPLPQAAPILCAGLTVYSALKNSGLRAGQILAITGAGGGLGSLAIQYGRAMGFQVLAIDAAEKEEFCRRMGAELFVDPFASKNLTEDIVKLTKGGPHGVLNVANSAQAMNQSIDYVRTNGTVILVALPKGQKVSFDILSAVLKCVHIRGSYVGSREDADEALGFVARGLVKAPVEIRPFNELVPTLDALSQGKLKGRVVLDLWK